MSVIFGCPTWIMDSTCGSVVKSQWVSRHPQNRQCAQTAMAELQCPSAQSTSLDMERVETDGDVPRLVRYLKILWPGGFFVVFAHVPWKIVLICPNSWSLYLPQIGQNYWNWIVRSLSRGVRETNFGWVKDGQSSWVDTFKHKQRCGSRNKWLVISGDWPKLACSFVPLQHSAPDLVTAAWRANCGILVRAAMFHHTGSKLLHLALCSFMFYSHTHTHTQTERTRWRDLKSPKHLSPSISWPERCPISLYVIPLGAKYEFLWILKFSGCCSDSPHLPHRTWHGHFHTAELPGTHSPKATAEDLEARLLVQSGTPAAAGRSGSWGPMSTASYWVRTRSGWSLFDSAVLFLSFLCLFRVCFVEFHEADWSSIEHHATLMPWMKEHLQSIGTVEIYFLSPAEAFGIVRVIGFQHPSHTSSQGQDLKPETWHCPNLSHGSPTVISLVLTQHPS